MHFDHTATLQTLWLSTSRINDVIGGIHWFSLETRFTTPYPTVMAAILIARKFAALMVVLTLVVGVAPVKAEGTAMDPCCMGMNSADMQASTIDQYDTQMPDQQLPCMDINGHCMMVSGSPMALPPVGYAPAFASRSNMPGWPPQAELASTRARPDIPPPIAII